MFNKKFIALVMATLVAGSALTGCGSSGKSSKGETLTVWSKVTDKEREVIQTHANNWGKENGYEVKVLDDAGGAQDFLQVANSSKAPDMYIGVGHDNLSTYQVAGVVDEVPSTFDRTGYVNESVWNATAIGGKNYAVPFAQETVALLYNTDKVKEVPKTMEELIEVAKAHGPNGFQIDLGNFYITGGIIQTTGGYIFGGEEGNLNGQDIGLASPGSIAGFQFLQDLVQKHKLMPVDVTGDIAAANFKSGESIFYISGSWDIAQMVDAGINVGVAEVPSIGGKPYKSFLGVQTGFVTAKSSKKDAAWKLMEHLSKNMAEDYFTAGKRIPVRQSVIDSGLTSEDQYFQGFLDQSKNAVPMPNIIEMQAVWSSTGSISRIIKGEDPSVVAPNIVDGIKKGIQTQQ